MRGHGKQELKAYFGCICMLGGKIKKDSELTYHHINKKCNGGKKSTNNGALISGDMHKIMHEIEHKQPEFYKQIQYYFRCYKREDEETRELFRQLAYEDVMRHYKALTFNKKCDMIN